jgi:hypothetical protein
MCQGPLVTSGEDLLHDHVAAVLPHGLDQLERQGAAVEGVRLPVRDLDSAARASAWPARTCTVPKSPVWAGAAGALIRCAGDCLGKMPGYGACRPIGRTR